MPKPASHGGSPIIERVGISISVGQVRKVPRPAHSYGSPAMDVKKEAAEAERRRAAEATGQAPDADEK